MIGLKFRRILWPGFVFKPTHNMAPLYLFIYAVLFTRFLININSKNHLYSKIIKTRKER